MDGEEKLRELVRSRIKQNSLKSGHYISIQAVIDEFSPETFGLTRDRHREIVRDELDKAGIGY